MNQNEVSKTNKEAWDANAYEAWIKKLGSPEEAAKPLVDNPKHKLRRVIKHLGDLKEKIVGNPLGSNGRLAVAMALLGGEVTVFDISESNKRFAQELADCVNVKIEYIVGDFLDILAVP